MSAFDVTGAVLSGILAIVFFFYFATWDGKNEEDQVGLAVWIVLISVVWFSFCVARLMGAHL